VCVRLAMVPEIKAGRLPPLDAAESNLSTHSRFLADGVGSEGWGSPSRRRSVLLCILTP
jgi:hypothetical protein